MVTVQVHPRSTQTRVEADVEGVIHVWTAAPPVEGKANLAVLKAIATWAGVSASQVRLVSGSRSRRKLVEIPSKTDR